ncbi:MAG: zinc-ribbon domain-containing protein [Promethearchaeota archaeon]
MPKTKLSIFEKGRQLLKQGKYEAAIYNFNRVIKKLPQYELAWREKAKALYYIKNYEEAIICIDRALELKSSSADAWLTKMDILLQFNKYEEALNCCNEALKIHPNKYWFQMAYVHEQFKDFKEALGCVDKALAHNPKNTKAQRVKSALLNGIDYGKNYYIPIAKSPLLDIIPPEDDIIYSTRIIMDWKLKFPRGDFPKMLYTDTIIDSIIMLESAISWLEGVEKDKGIIITDSLITPKGLALFLPDVKRQELIGPQYLSWDKVAFTSEGEMIINNVFFCKLHREPLYEPLDEFTERYKTFHNKIMKLRQLYTKECLEKASSYAELNQDEKALQWVKEGYKSNVFLREYNLSDDLMLIEKSILDKRRIEAQQIIKGLEDLLINYFVMNKEKSFTAKAILYNLRVYIENPNALEYFKKNIKGLLNKLTFQRERILQSEQKDGITYYSLLTIPAERHIKIENFKDYKINEALLRKDFLRKEHVLDKKVSEKADRSIEPSIDTIEKELKAEVEQSIPPITEKKKEKPVKECPYCGQELSLEAKFCVQCGEKVEKLQRIPSITEEKKEILVKKCPYCGQELSLGAKFCVQCGERVEKLQPISSITEERIETPVIAEEAKPRSSISEKKKEKPKEISYICKFCGYKLNKKANVCPQCGIKIKKI